jgi:cytochrome c biogenesis protein
LFDQGGNEVKRKIIFVNEPLVFDNVTLYQTDWDIVELKFKLDNNKVFQIPLKKIAKGGNRFWFGSLALDGLLDDGLLDEKLTVVANDLNGKVLLYDSKGVLVKESSIGGFIPTDKGTQIQISDFMTSTGLQIKSDPGIGVVYLSFFLLIISIYISFFTYSQILLVELSDMLQIGGNSNRSVLFFQEDFRKIVRRSVNT